MLALSTVTPLQTVTRETREAYSGSRKIARYLASSGLDRAELAMPRAWPNFGLAVLVHGELRLVRGVGPRLAERAVLVNGELPERLRGRVRLLYRTQRPVWRRNGRAILAVRAGLAGPNSLRNKRARGGR